MEIEELKTGLFGYQKASVYMLVSSMEEEFSAKLLEKDTQHAKLLKEAQAKIAALEEELQTLRTEQQSQSHQQSLISQTLLDAQAYAQKLRKDTQEQEQFLRCQIQEKVDQQKSRLNEYTQQLNQLRSSFRALLQAMDNQTSQLEQQAQKLSVAISPTESNLSLFPGKMETEANAQIQGS